MAEVAEDDVHSLLDAPKQNAPAFWVGSFGCTAKVPEKMVRQKSINTGTSTYLGAKYVR